MVQPEGRPTFLKIQLGSESLGELLKTQISRFYPQRAHFENPALEELRVCSWVTSTAQQCPFQMRLAHDSAL